MSLFKENNKDESYLYSRIRDHESSLRKRLEEYWERFEPYSDKGFLNGIEKEDQFHQKWWEMYLGIGLLNLKLNLNPSRQIEGPDFEINLSDRNLWVEAVAPKLGTGNNSLPELIFNSSGDLPEREFLLRLTNSLDEKLRKFENYKNEFISGNDAFIIAISSCDLSEYDSLMDFPVPAPLKILASAGNLVINEEANYVNPRNKIHTKSGSPVNTNWFENENFSVLYSNSQILTSNRKPEESFQLFLNPKNENNYLFQLFNGIDIWHRVTTTDGHIWEKKSA